MIRRLEVEEEARDEDAGDPAREREKARVCVGMVIVRIVNMRGRRGETHGWMS